MVLRDIAADGHAPDVAALAAELDVRVDEVSASLRRLDDNHGLVLHPGRDQVWLAHPFSLSPTGVWVSAGARGWWAPCLWCALGIQALVGERVAIHCRVGGEAEAVVIEADQAGVSGGPSGGLIAHFPQPPRQAWDNVVHFCACLLPFRSEADLAAWCERHRLPRGVAMPLTQLQALARRWYGRHLDLDWVKWTPAQAAEIFAAVGLVGPFWALDRSGERF
jgi:hypothetical protein